MAELAGQGKVYVFSNGPAGWMQTAEMSPTVKRVSNDTFGDSISVSADGGTAAISEPGYTDPGSVVVESRDVFDLDGRRDPARGLSTVCPTALGCSSPLDAAGTRLLLADPTQSSAVVYDVVNGTWTKTRDPDGRGVVLPGREGGAQL